MKYVNFWQQLGPRALVHPSGQAVLAATAADEVGECCILAQCSGADDDLQVTFPSFLFALLFLLACMRSCAPAENALLPHDFEGALGSKEPSRFPVSRTQVSNRCGRSRLETCCWVEVQELVFMPSFRIFWCT